MLREAIKTQKRQNYPKRGGVLSVANNFPAFRFGSGFYKGQGSRQKQNIPLFNLIPHLEGGGVMRGWYCFPTLTGFQL